MSPADQRKLPWNILTDGDGLSLLADLLPLLEALQKVSKPDTRMLDDPIGTQSGIEVNILDSHNQLYKVIVHLGEDELILHHDDGRPAEWRLNTFERLARVIDITRHVLAAPVVPVAPSASEQICKAALLRTAILDGNPRPGDTINGTIRYATPLATGGAYIHYIEEDDTYHDETGWEEPGPIQVCFIESNEPEDEYEGVIISPFGHEMTFTFPGASERKQLDRDLTTFLNARLTK